jgi:hypothetical protein
MNKQIEDMTDKDIKEYMESDRGKAARRLGVDRALDTIMECLRHNQEQSLKLSELKNERTN